MKEKTLLTLALLCIVANLAILFLQEKAGNVSILTYERFSQALKNQEIQSVDYENRKLIGRLKPEFIEKYGTRSFQLSEPLEIQDYQELLRQKISTKKFFGEVKGLEETLPLSPELSKIRIAEKKPLFQPGEKIILSVEAFRTEAGQIELAVRKPEVFNGRAAYKFSLALQTDPRFGLFFNAKNRAELLMDMSSLMPLISLQVQNEDQQHLSTKSILDPISKNLTISEKGVSKKRGWIENTKTYPWQEGTQTALSALFYLRTLNFKQTVQFAVQEKGKLLNIQATPVAKENITTNLGTLEATKLQIKVLQDGKELKVGDLFAWLGNQAPHPILQIEAKIKIAHIVAKVKELSNANLDP